MQRTISYGYGNTEWGDLLTTYNGKSISYDTIGNPLSDGTWTYTWQQGRQLASMKKSGATWTFTYDANGMRTKRTDGTTVYTYAYNGSQLSWMNRKGTVMRFTYSTDGRPLRINYGGTVYYYVTNLQGDVVAILNSDGNKVVGYTYDAWGRLLSTTGSMASTLGVHNPLRYRGYVYDTETGLYYLQSRYYNPTIGRFINADSQLSTGNLTGLNLFAYCGNNPVNALDPHGNSAVAIGVFIGIATIVGAAVGAFTAACTGGNVLEAAIEGAVTGAVATAATIFVPKLVVAFLPATASAATVALASATATFGVAAADGFVVDASAQLVSQVFGEKTEEGIGIEWSQAGKTALMTGVAAIVPTFVDPSQSILQAIAAATIGMDASAINAVIDVIITLFIG